jgi:hypothetical protein
MLVVVVLMDLHKLLLVVMVVEDLLILHRVQEGSKTLVVEVVDVVTQQLLRVVEEDQETVDQVLSSLHILHKYSKTPWHLNFELIKLPVRQD